MPGEVTALLCARGYEIMPKNSRYLLCQNDGTWKTANSYPGLPTCEGELSKSFVDLKEFGKCRAAERTSHE